MSSGHDAPADARAILRDVQSTGGAKMIDPSIESDRHEV